MKSSARPLGSKLKERRLLLGVSIDELSQVSGVAAKYLRWIERDEWSFLPGGVYTKGFLRKYAQAVGENPEKIIRAFEKKSGEAKLPVERKKSALWLPQNVSPRALRNIIIGVVLLALVGYIVYQLSPVLARPEVNIETPKDAETVVREDSIVLAGRTEGSASVYLNGHPLALSNEGRFETVVELLPGLNVLEIKAVSRFGKERVEERKIIFIEP